MKTDTLTFSNLRIWVVAAIVAIIAGPAIGLSPAPAPLAVVVSIILGSVLVVALELAPLKWLSFFSDYQTSVVASTVDDSRVAEWTEDMEFRFNQLAIMEALGTISKGGRQELKTLQRSRRADLCPRSTEQLTQEKKRREAHKRLLKALDEYIRTHEPTDSSGREA